MPRCSRPSSGAGHKGAVLIALWSVACLKPSTSAKAELQIDSALAVGIVLRAYENGGPSDPGWEFPPKVIEFRRHRHAVMVGIGPNQDSVMAKTGGLLLDADVGFCIDATLSVVDPSNCT